MKKILILILVSTSLISCRKYLDINSDPDTPQDPDPTSVFPTLIANIPGGGGERGTGGVQSDALWIGSYIQFWHSRTNDASAVGQADWDRHGYNSFTGDRAAGIWRLLYFGAGKGMEYCINEGIKRGQWDVVGATLAIKAYLFQITTNYHGEIIFNDAFKEDSIFFKWDDQSVVYKGVDSLCRLAIDYLNRTDYGTSAVQLSVRGDVNMIYNGDVNKWKKFAYGILARNFAALINKPSYSADSVIKYADLGPNTIAGTDDFLIPFEASRNADANWFGSFRDNVTNLRQSDYIVRLLDGRVFTGATTVASRDPRMRHMLSKSIDTTNGNGGYRGIVPNVTNTSGNTAVPTLWGDGTSSNTGSGNFAVVLGKYLFQNKVVFPIMTYSEMQFMKAEAALRKSDRIAAYTAYKNGIQGHFNFINRTSYSRNNAVLYNLTQITSAEQTAYLAGPNVRQLSSELTLGDIMQQKFIALWGWGFVETWTDMRKYHYTDIDPTATGITKVYSGMNMPTAIFSDNISGPYVAQYGPWAYRVRPRYNSEYVWNIYVPDIAQTIYYHTIPTWFSLP
jgi:hypothetical protein